MVSNGNIHPHHVHQNALAESVNAIPLMSGMRIAIICTVCRHRPAVPINTVIGNQVMLSGCQYFSSGTV